MNGEIPGPIPANVAVEGAPHLGYELTGHLTKELTKNLADGGVGRRARKAANDRRARVDTLSIDDARAAVDAAEAPVGNEQSAEVEAPATKSRKSRKPRSSTKADNQNVADPDESETSTPEGNSGPFGPPEGNMVDTSLEAPAAPNFPMVDTTLEGPTGPPEGEMVDLGENGDGTHANKALTSETERARVLGDKGYALPDGTVVKDFGALRDIYNAKVHNADVNFSDQNQLNDWRRLIAAMRAATLQQAEVSGANAEERLTAFKSDVLKREIEMSAKAKQRYLDEQQASRNQSRGNTQTAGNPFDKAPTGPGYLDRDRLQQNEALNAKVAAASEKFAKLSAERRGKRFGGKKALAEAKQEYDDARNEAGSFYATQMKELGWSDETIRAFSRAAGVLELASVSNNIKGKLEDTADSKHWPIRKLNEFWAHNTGRKDNGKLNWMGIAKKGVVLAALTAVPGAGVAFLASGVLASVGAGAIGAGIGAGATSGIARSIFRMKLNEGGNAKTGAAIYADAMMSDNESSIMTRTDHAVHAEAISNLLNEQTEKLTRLNKRRLVGAVALGAVGAVGGYGLGRVVSGSRHIFGGHGGGNHAGGSGSGVNVVESHPTGGGHTAVIDHAGNGHSTGVEHPGNVHGGSNPNALDAGAILKAQADANNGKYTWTVAHDLTPGKEGPTAQAALDKFNAATGRHFILGPRNGTTQIFEGAHTINPDEMRLLNQVMIDMNK